MESKDAERVEIVQVEALVKATNAVSVPDQIRKELIRTLSPVAERMAGYAEMAQTINVTCQDDADNAAKADKEIAADIKLVEGNDVLSKIIRGLDQLHGKAVAVRSLFVGPMKGYRKTIRQPVLDWEADEKKKADDLARKLNAEAAAKAAREQAALLKKADAVKAPEKQEAYREQAAATVAPTVHVPATKSGLRVSKAWTVKGINEAEFYGALVNNPSFRGFVEINKTRLARAKAANPSMEITGVVFEQVTR